MEAVLPYPNAQSIYFPFPILLLVIVFISTPTSVALKTSIYVVAFVLMVYHLKSPDVLVNELYIATGTFITALVGYVIAARIRHESAQYIEELHVLGTTDPLTGLNNKKAFEDLCNEYFRQDLTDRDYAMLFTDIDKFKQINDKYGHPFGDVVLREVAGIIREIFADKAYSCRYGGDEFVVLMTDVKGIDAVKSTVADFRAAVSRLGSAIGLEALSCSVGVAVKADERVRYSEILSRSDSALYVAKKRRLSCVVIDRYGKTDEIGGFGAAQNGAAQATVLIVDDSAVNRSILRNILKDTYTILEADNGQTALEALRNGNGAISAVLLDLSMPIMDGYDFLMHKHDDELIANVPVIVTTVSDDEESERRALSLGANDFLMKPYRHTIVANRLENVIKLYHYSIKD